MVLAPPWTPELLPSVQHRLSAHLLGCAKPPRVLEYGSGWSTVWFALQGCEVTSVEHHRGWADAVRTALRELQCERTVTLVETNRMADAFCVRAVPELWYDLVLVDCEDEQRSACLRAAVPKLRLDGLMVLDDSHWPMLQPALAELACWDCCVLDGQHVRKTGAVHYHCTSVFRRPAACISA
jgi:predicted O-methyltransferase YrrM